ncbi:MAG TPA: hypothetical protein GX529_00350 [Firmicutes bacterium]|nr:hypothetical protein [Candidatus Fermentithermobacillaceae bacterium]
MRSRKHRNIKLNLVWVFVGLIAIAFAARQVEVIRIRKQLVQLESEIEYYMMLNATLQEQVETLRSKDYIEKTAREKLGLVMPGEVQYIPVKNQGGQ